MRKIVIGIGALLLVAVLAPVAILGWAIWEYGGDLPDFLSASQAVPPVPPLVAQAFLAAEDPTFLQRPPFNPVVEYGGLLVHRQPQRPHAPALISLEVAKHMLPSVPGRRLEWAFKVNLLKYRLEHSLPKERILAVYLREVYLGRGAEGVAAAADLYFGKSPAELSLAEAAYLAGLAKAPGYLPGNNELGRQRRDQILSRMEEAGSISPDQADAAKTEPLVTR